MRDYDQKLRNKWVGMIKKDKKGTKKFNELTDLLIATDEKKFINLMRRSGKD